MGMTGLEHLTVPQFIRELQHCHLCPSEPTRSRWRSLENNLGHYRHCRRTGNNFPTCLRGFDLILLALYCAVYPKAKILKINAFLYNANFGNPTFCFYSPLQICLAETRIGLSRKAGSTTAYQALLPRNIRKRFNYWNLPYPLGIADC